MCYFDAFEHDSYDDADNLMNNSFDNNVCSYNTIFAVNNAEVHKKEPDYIKLQPYFSWLPVNIIKKTFQHTAQYGRTPTSTVLKTNYKSHFLSMNASRCNGPVDTDTVYRDTPAIDDGSTSAQIFAGKNTLLTDEHGMKSDKEFDSVLSDNVRQHSAIDKPIRYRVQAEIMNKVKYMLHTLFIDD